MTALRQRMLEDMRVRNLSPHTQSSYVLQVSLFARHFGRSPEELGPDEIRAWQVHLTDDRKLSPASIKVGDKEIKAFDAKLTPDGNSFDAESKAKIAEFKKHVAEATKAAGYPPKADPAQVNKPLVVAILTVLVIFVTMVYGPIAAMLVEMFPTRIRYTSMSLPYHIGNGWFGGLLPTTAFAIVAQTGNIYNGLWWAGRLSDSL